MKYKLYCGMKVFDAAVTISSACMLLKQLSGTMSQLR